MIGLRVVHSRWILLLVGWAAILVWQSHLYRHSQDLDKTYVLRSSTGITRHHQYFVPFLHHLGLYPIATTERPFEDSPQGLLRIIEEKGETLRMEIRHAMRYGDHLRTYLYLPDVWLSGKTTGISLIPASMIWFWCALLAMYYGFWRIQRPWWGVIAVLLMGSNPFQLMMVYQTENIFSYGVSTCIFFLGLHLPLLENQRALGGRYLLLALLSGVLLGSLSHIRVEPVMILFSCLGVYLTLSRGAWRWRIALSVLLLVGFSSASAAWGNFFDAKFTQAHATVKAAGGVPFDGPRQSYHPFWHTLYTGLGDFDYRYGHKWDDRVSFRRITPHLQEKYRVQIPPWDGKSYVFTTAFWDEGKSYYKTPYELPHYSDAARDLFLKEILDEPVWYLNILLRRGWTLLTELVPLRLEWGSGRLTLPWSGFLIFPAMAWLAWRRDWFAIKLILFGTTLSLTAFLVYSGRGMSYYSLHHYLVALALVFHFLRNRAGRGSDYRLPLSA